MKIIHIINSLNKSGAEGNLYRLCKFQKKKYKKKIDIIVITLIDNGYYEPLLKKNGIKIFSLGWSKKNKYFEFIKKILKLRKFIKKENPDIIQSWMYHSNFVTLFLSNAFNDKIFWNIRHSELNFQISKKTTILISIICGFFSKIVPKKIIYCSEKSIKFHVNQQFYCKNKTKLIYNGYSDKEYYSSKYLNYNFRKKNKINKTVFILGFAGRYAEQKNIPSILQAFSNIVKVYKNVYFYMVGKDLNFSNKALVSIISDLKIRNKIIFLKEQKNLLEFYNGIDLLLLASHSESFPNVVAEAMLCSTPVLSSDAGCAKTIIKNHGFIIRDNKPLAIKIGLIKSIETFRNNKKIWNSLKRNSRLQIKKNFSIETMSNLYFENWIS